jgi:hypothetical protein
MSGLSSLVKRRARARRAVGATVVAAAVVITAAAPAGAAFNPYPATPLDLWGQTGTAYAVEIVGTTAYVGGAFTEAARYKQRAPRVNLMAINMAAPPSQSLTTFQADTNDGGTVRALASDGLFLYVGGQFTSIDGVPRTRLARINLGTGEVDPGFSYNVNNTVRDLLVVNNTLYLVGDFTAINGTTRRRAAAINLANLQLSTTFNPNLNAKTYAVAHSAATGQILVGGNFTTVGAAPAAPRNYLAAVDPTSGAVRPAVYNQLNDLVLDITTGNAGNGERVFIAGGGGFNSAAAWNITGGARIWRMQANGDVQAVRFANNNVYFGFHDGFTIDGVPNNTLRLLAGDAATTNPNGELVPGFAPASSGAVGVMAIDTTNQGTTNNTYLVSAGKFPRMGGVAVRGVSVHRAA